MLTPGHIWKVKIWSTYDKRRAFNKMALKKQSESMRLYKEIDKQCVTGKIILNKLNMTFEPPNTE